MRPLVVLVHGSLSSADEWAGYQDLLPDAEVLTLDLPGHGDRIGEPFTTDAAVALIADAVDTRAKGQPVFLAGHSLGGYMATAYAARHPGRLDALVLIGATGDPTGPLAGLYRGFAWLTERVNHRRLAELRNRFARPFGFRGERFAGASAYDSLPAAWRAVMADCPPQLLTQVTCPVLFVNGQFDQMRCHERRYLRLATKAQLMVVPRATHLAPLTHAPWVASAITTFAADLIPCRA